MKNFEPTYTYTLFVHYMNSVREAVSSFMYEFDNEEECFKMYNNASFYGNRKLGITSIELSVIEFGNIYAERTIKL